MKEEPATKNDGSSCLDGSEVSPSSSTSSVRGAPVQPRGDKLMRDAIRGYVDTKALGVIAKTNKIKKRKRCDVVFWAGMGNDGMSTTSAGADMDVSLDKIGVVDDRLRHILKELDASPVRVYGKKLFKSDRLVGQNRMLMSCKSWLNTHGVPFPFDEILTDKEKTKDGVIVQAYDRHGRPYNLICRKLESNMAYRLIAHWGNFLKQNNLDVQDGGGAGGLAMIDLWAFRSPKLKTAQTDHPDGALGLVMVHYREGDAPHADAAIAEALAGAGNQLAMPVEADADGPDDAVVVDPVHVHEDAVPVLEEDAAADTEHVWEDAVDEPDEDMLEAARAMIMLSQLRTFSAKKEERKKTTIS